MTLFTFATSGAPFDLLDEVLAAFESLLAGSAFTGELLLDFSGDLDLPAAALGVFLGDSLADSAALPRAPLLGGGVAGSGSFLMDFLVDFDVEGASFLTDLAGEDSSLAPDRRDLLEARSLILLGISGNSMTF